MVCTRMGKFPEQKFVGVELQILPMGYNTWGCPIFVLQEGLSVLTKWEPKARYVVYLGQHPFNADSVVLVLNIRTGNVTPSIMCSLTTPSTLYIMRRMEQSQEIVKTWWRSTQRSLKRKT